MPDCTSEVSHELLSGCIEVGTVAINLAKIQRATRGVLIRAFDSNTDVVCVGRQGVTADNVPRLALLACRCLPAAAYSCRSRPAQSFT